MILDVWFSNDARGLPELTNAIKGLRVRPRGAVDVYASFNPDADGKQNAEQLWREHAQDVYRSALTGYGHSSLDLFMGVLSYKRELQIPGGAGTTELMWALPTRVAIDMGRLDEQSSSDSVVLPVGSENHMGDHTVAFVHAGNSTTPGAFVTSRTATARTEPKLDKKIIVIGSLAEDRYQRGTAGGTEVDCLGDQRPVEAR